MRFHEIYPSVAMKSGPLEKQESHFDSAPGGGAKLGVYYVQDHPRKAVSSCHQIKSKGVESWKVQNHD
jgi:hypothetical protein